MSSTVIRYSVIFNIMLFKALYSSTGGRIRGITVSALDRISYHLIIVDIVCMSVFMLGKCMNIVFPFGY